jgi:hypothetical protein
MQRIIQEYPAGADVREYCKKNKISAGKYYYWRKRLEGKGSGSKFFEVRGINGSSGHSIEMQTVKGTIFRFSPGVGFDYMRELSQL